MLKYFRKLTHYKLRIIFIILFIDVDLNETKDSNMSNNHTVVLQQTVEVNCNMPELEFNIVNKKLTSLSLTEFNDLAKDLLKSLGTG